MPTPTPPQPDPTPSKPGPTPDTLKLDGDWEQNVKRSLEKKRPPEGWPKPDEGKK